jgi:hypothetical protein
VGRWSHEGWESKLRPTCFGKEQEELLLLTFMSLVEQPDQSCERVAPWCCSNRGRSQNTGLGPAVWQDFRIDLYYGWRNLRDGIGLAAGVCVWMLAVGVVALTA